MKKLLSVFMALIIVLCAIPASAYYEEYTQPIYLGTTTIPFTYELWQEYEFTPQTSGVYTFSSQGSYYHYSYGYLYDYDYNEVDYITYYENDDDSFSFSAYLNAYETYYLSLDAYTWDEDTSASSTLTVQITYDGTTSALTPFNAPTNLEWHKNASGETMYGAIRWSAVSYSNVTYDVNVYCNNQNVYGFEYSTSPYYANGYIADEFLVYDSVFEESGSYYFTVQALGDGTHSSSPVAQSPVFYYTLPNQAIQTPTVLSVNNNVITHTTVPNAAAYAYNIGYYDEYNHYSLYWMDFQIADEIGNASSASWDCSYAFGGYYDPDEMGPLYVQVITVSNNILYYQNSAPTQPYQLNSTGGGSDVPAMSAPTELRWNFDPNSNATKYGTVSWRTVPESNGEYTITVYRDGEKIDKIHYSGMHDVGYDGYKRATLYKQNDIFTQSGTYTFTVSVEDNDGNLITSALSAPFIYTLPYYSVATPVISSFENGIITHTYVSGADGYNYEFKYMTEDGLQKCGTTMTSKSTPDSNNMVVEDASSQISRWQSNCGFTLDQLYVAVMAISSDITQYQNSAQTEAFHYGTAALEKPEITYTYAANYGSYVSLYVQSTGDGEMLALGTTAAGEVETAIVRNGTANFSPDVTSIKLFVWDSLTSMQPLCDPVTVPVY